MSPLQNIRLILRRWNCSGLGAPLVVEANLGKVYYTKIEGIKSTYFCTKAWRWLNVVTQRIYPFENTTNVRYLFTNLMRIIVRIYVRIVKIRIPLPIGLIKAKSM